MEIFELNPYREFLIALFKYKIDEFQVSFINYLFIVSPE